MCHNMIRTFAEVFHSTDFSLSKLGFCSPMALQWIDFTGHGKEGDLRCGSVRWKQGSGWAWMSGSSGRWEAGKERDVESLGCFSMYE